MKFKEPRIIKIIFKKKNKFGGFAPSGLKIVLSHCNDEKHCGTGVRTEAGIKAKD